MEIKRGERTLSIDVSGRWVSKVSSDVGHHSFTNNRINRSCGIIIEINRIGFTGFGEHAEFTTEKSFDGSESKKMK